MRKNIHNFFIYWFIVLFLFFLVLEQFSLLDYGDTLLNNSFICSSDSLICYTYCKDITDHFLNIANWSLGKYMSYFPNCIIMWFVQLFTIKTILAQVIYGIIQFFLFIFTTNYLLKTIYPKVNSISLSISNLLLSLFLVYSIANSDFIVLTNNLFLPYNTGAYIGVIISLIFLFKYIKNSNKGSCTWFIITYILSIISNPIALIYMGFPMIGAIILLYIFNKLIQREKLLRTFLIIVGTTIVGYILFSTISNTFYHKRFEIPFFSIKRIGPSFQLMFNHYYMMLTSPNLLGIILWLTIASFGFSFYISCNFLFRKPEPPNNDNLFYVYSLFFVLFSIMTFFSPAICGLYLDFSSIRYSIVLLFMALLNIGINVEYLQSKYQFNQFILPSILVIFLSSYIVFFFINAKKVSPFECFKKIDLYYPTFVKAVDELSERYNIKNGIGDYWDAGYVSTLSKKGVRINCVFQDLRPYIYYCNFNNYYWTDYTKKKKVIYNFISIRNFNDTTTIWNIFDHNKIKKVCFEGFQFYLVPDFTINQGTENIEIIK